ncbi:hypothetical protein PENTCL1PPCAC_8405, partial [Pristionchus entomophagus]
QTYFVISPDSISDATPLLQHLRLVEPPANENGLSVHQSDRYLNDCTFYAPSSTLNMDDEQALMNMPGVSMELFAEFSQKITFSPYIFENALIESAQRKMPLFLFPSGLCDRKARDLIESYCIFCSNPPKEKWIAQNSNENLMFPHVYNPSVPGDNIIRDEVELVTAMQSALLEYGSYEWRLAGRLAQTEYHPSVFRFYRRIIAEREFILRDEMLIERIGTTLTDEKLKAPSNNLDRINLDAFINKIVETIIRGERLVNIRPPFADKETADKLAIFIR